MRVVVLGSPLGIFFTKREFLKRGKHLATLTHTRKDYGKLRRKLYTGVFLVSQLGPERETLTWNYHCLTFYAFRVTATTQMTDLFLVKWIQHFSFSLSLIKLDCFSGFGYCFMGERQPYYFVFLPKTHSIVQSVLQNLLFSTLISLFLYIRSVYCCKRIRLETKQPKMHSQKAPLIFRGMVCRDYKMNKNCFWNQENFFEWLCHHGNNCEIFSFLLLSRG